MNPHYLWYYVNELRSKAKRHPKDEYVLATPGEILAKRTVDASNRLLKTQRKHLGAEYNDTEEVPMYAQKQRDAEMAGEHKDPIEKLLVDLPEATRKAVRKRFGLSDKDLKLERANYYKVVLFFS